MSAPRRALFLQTENPPAVSSRGTFCCLLPE
nr:MAG TPA: hypothetical protein [Caudoviricetes sp.]